MSAGTYAYMYVHIYVTRQVFMYMLGTLLHLNYIKT